MMNYYYGYGMHPDFGVGGFFSFVWFVFILWLFIVLFRRLFGDHSQPSTSTKTDEALNILKKRYAQGDITKKEFDQMKKDIS